MFLPILTPLLSEFLWSYVAKGNPNDYLKTLELKSRGIYKYFVIFVASYGFSLLSLYYFLVFKNTDLLLVSIIAFAAITLMLIGFSIFTVLILVTGNAAVLYNWKGYLRTTARACFLMVAKEKDSEKRISTFKVGLECVNEYAKYRFGLGLLKFQYYCNFFKLIALSRNEEEKVRIRNALNNFAFRLNNELDLTDIILATRRIIGMPIFHFEDLYQELEFDISIGKRISNHKELITFVVGALTVALTFISIYPLLSSAWNGLHLPNPFVSAQVILKIGQTLL